jgi:hypothetical protein
MNNTMISKFQKTTSAFLSIALCAAFSMSSPSAFAADTDMDTTNSSAPAAPRDTRRPRVGEIDAAQKDRYRTRYESKNSTVFSFGPGFANNLNQSKALYSLGFGYEWEVGAQNAVLAQVNGSFGDSTAYVDGIIGGKYYFSDEDISPFAKAGFGFGSAKGQDLSTVGGFAGMVGVGATVFRTSSTHLEVGATYSTLFASNAQGNPSVTSLTLGILF